MHDALVARDEFLKSARVYRERRAQRRQYRGPSSAWCPCRGNSLVIRDSSGRVRTPRLRLGFGSVVPRRCQTLFGAASLISPVIRNVGKGMNRT